MGLEEGERWRRSKEGFWGGWRRGFGGLEEGDLAEGEREKGRKGERDKGEMGEGKGQQSNGSIR